MKNRINQLRELMQIEGIDSFLITSPFNLRYLAGFTGTTGVALITKNKCFFITDFRYLEQVANQCVDYQIVENRGPIFESVVDLVEKEAIKNLAFEEENVSFKHYAELEMLLEAELIPVSGMIESLREIKDDTEIVKIEKACQIADEAFSYIITYIKPGMSEIQVANELENYMKQLGASKVSFETIVASGVRSAMPHGVASDKIIDEGDLVTIDFGCYYDGYVSDMTRTIAMGEPKEELKKIYKIVKEAQQLVIDAARPGITGAELDAVARDYITKKGYGDYFGHGTGHGIGLDIHESPNVTRGALKPFVPGNVITDEPGIYLPGVGGVRIEDDLLITDRGVKRLTYSTKDLIVLEN